MDIDAAVKSFLDLRRIAVAGVSRSGSSPANAIAERLRETDHEVFAVNPAGEPVDGHPCYPSIGAIEGGVEGVVVVTSPDHARVIAQDAAASGAEWIWFHQGFGPVSFDDETLRVANEAGLKVISAGCPMMYCCPDGFHRCARAVFRFFGRIPAEVDVAT
jgi:predicted CoA-binding protein